MTPIMEPRKIRVVRRGPWEKNERKMRDAGKVEGPLLGREGLGKKNSARGE